MKLQIITLILAGFALNAMERDLDSSNIQEPKKANIAITNKTNWKLLLKYGNAVYGGGGSFDVTIVPQQRYEFINDLEDPIILIPYGQALQYTQINKPTDLTKEIKKIDFDPENNKIEITVQQASKAASWLSAKGTLGSLISQAISPIEGLVSAFEISLKSVPLVKFKGEEIKDVIDAFPSVKTALASGRQPIARYYLNLPEGANQDSVDKEYLNLKEKYLKLDEELMKKPEDERKDKQNIFPVILRILELAHNALIAELQLKEASDILLAKK